jgi:hypothetical protein
VSEDLTGIRTAGHGAIFLGAMIRHHAVSGWYAILGFPNGDNDDNWLGMDRRALPSQGYEDCIHAGL